MLSYSLITGRGVLTSSQAFAGHLVLRFLDSPVELCLFCVEVKFSKGKDELVKFSALGRLMLF